VEREKRKKEGNSRGFKIQEKKKKASVSFYVVEPTSEEGGKETL